MYSINFNKLNLFSAQSPQKLAQLLNDQDESGCSPLHYASKSGQIRSLVSLISLGASVRTKNHQNESPLHFAAMYVNIEHKK